MNGNIAELIHPKAGRPVTQYVYRAANGDAVLVANRFENRDGSKFFLPFDVAKGEWKAPGVRPLYNLDRLAANDNRPVILVEGEKCADALTARGHLATTTFGGANAARKADLAPLAGREIIIWPDNDGPGRAYAAGIADTLHKAHGTAAKVIPISDELLCKVTYRNEADAEPNLTCGKGWDAADAIAEGWTDEQIDRLLALAKAHAPSDPKPAASPALFTDMKLWHTPGRAAFASIRRNGHWEHFPVESKAFGDLLAHRHYKEEGKAPSGTALEDLKRQYRGEALFEGEEHPCFIRLGEADGKLYLDLGAPDWSAVEIDATGWRIVADPPVKFRRPNSARALPAPAPGAGDVSLLRRFVNVETEADFQLAVGWLLGCLHPTGPYPLLILAGEQGSAKSSTAKALRRLVDPAEPESRSSPGDERDLVIAATNSRVLSFDNLSTIKPAIADAFCRLATGGGFGTRKLHTNDEEMLFNVTRPCLLNGIPDLASRPDLADRAIILNLPVIPEAERRYEAEFWREFEAARPRILAGLLNAVTGALARHETVELSWRPRMADFARWVTAAEPALGWPEGAFMAAYAHNREEVGDGALDGSAVAQAVLQLVEEDGEWEGTATDLFTVLRGRYPALTADRSAFSANPSQLGSDLRRIEPLLRSKGVRLTREKRGRNRSRLIILKRA